jgi:hypothetical protein
MDASFETVTDTLRRTGQAGALIATLLGFAMLALVITCMVLFIYNFLALRDIKDAVVAINQKTRPATSSAVVV